MPISFEKNNVGKSSEEIHRLSRFVIHEHHATHLHWDLRLELDGVLKSWALPKEPILPKNIKRLAIQVEDHTTSYLNFQGEIPEGHYGAGLVKIWDTGEFKIADRTTKKIVFDADGKKLNGRYCLLKVDYGINPEKNWLFFRMI